MLLKAKPSTKIKFIIIVIIVIINIIGLKSVWKYLLVTTSIDTSQVNCDGDQFSDLQ